MDTMKLEEEDDIWIKYNEHEIIATNKNRSYHICYVGHHYISVVESNPLDKEISFHDAMWNQDSKANRYFGYSFEIKPDAWIKLMKEDGSPTSLFIADPFVHNSG